MIEIYCACSCINYKDVHDADENWGTESNMCKACWNHCAWQIF